MSIASVMPSSHLILWCPLSFCPQSFSASVTSNESVVHIRWSNYWSISINPSKEYSGLISLTGLTGLISLQSKGLSGALSSTTVQRHQFFGTLAFFMVQLSQPYMTTGKTTTLSIGTLTIQTSSTLIIHKKLKTKRTIPLRIIQNPNVILYRKSETYYWWREYLFWTGPSSIKEQRISHLESVIPQGN